MTQFTLLVFTCPPDARTFKPLTRAPIINAHNACVSSCPSTYVRIGFGKNANTASHVPYPTQNASPNAPKLVLDPNAASRPTCHADIVTATHAGSSSSAM